MPSKRCQIITPEKFEQIDMGIYECETAAVVWKQKTDIFVIGLEDYAEYGYNDLVIAQCAEQSNRCLDWIEEKKAYIQEIILKKCMLWLNYDFEMAEKNFLDRLCLKKIKVEVNIQDKIQEANACMYIEVKPFFFHEHCHCIEVEIWEQEDGMYEADLVKDVQQLLLEVRDALKEKNAQACKWAKQYGFFYAFDEDGNMLAVVKQQFCLSISGKLISETNEDGIRKEGLSGNKQERSSLYFIRAEWETERYCADTWKGIPMPLGFVTEELNCKNGVFTITSSSGHKSVSGTFLVIKEALTMIEMLYLTRGVAEEEIERCYYTFLVEDHQRYIEKIAEKN